MGMVIAILSCFVIGSQRLNNIENNFDYALTEEVGCILPSNNATIDEMFKKKEKRQKDVLNLNVSGAICLDFDFPELLGQAAGANLVLSPAQTWSAHVGLQHLKMSSVRAIENGYWILRCDGGGASGLIGNK